MHSSEVHLRSGQPALQRRQPRTQAVSLAQRFFRRQRFGVLCISIIALGLGRRRVLQSPIPLATPPFDPDPSLLPRHTLANCPRHRRNGAGRVMRERKRQARASK